jgi:hypothetical protein
MYPSKAPVLRLPQELLDEILSDLEHRDLVALALASRAACALVIPRHTEYRILRTRHLLPAMWAHLARRADLARNIREVHICDRANRGASERVPRTLVLAEEKKEKEKGKIADAVEAETRRVRDVCKALGHMRRLHTFTWAWEVEPPARPTVQPGHENAILEVLARKKGLRHLGLSGMFGVHAPGAAYDQESTVYPVCGGCWLEEKVLNNRH